VAQGAGSVLITGGAGFIGSHLAERLLEAGRRVVVLDNFNTYYDPAVKRRNISSVQGDANYRLVEGDLLDRQTLFELFHEERPEVVAHLAARAGVRPSLEDPALYHRVNILGSQNIMEACRETGPSHLVWASSSSVYGGSKEVPFREDNPVARPVSPYAATKRMNELMAHVEHHVYGLNVTMLRFFTVYGPRQRPDMAIHKFTRLIDAGEPVPMFGDGMTARDYTYIDDIVDGLVRCVERPFGYEIINLGGHRTTQLRDLIGLIGKALGKEPRIERKPEQPGDVPLTYADVAKAGRLLDYAPQTPIEEGVGKFAAWYLAQKEA
jgi:UDP-glucuronate 4-epimerase